MDASPGILIEGARRVWRYQRVLWWIFVVNLVLAIFSSLPLVARLSRFAGNGFEMERFAKGFDLASFLALIGNPEAAFFGGATSSFVLAFLFLLFMLFVTGGFLEAYRQDRKLSAAEFFHYSGAFFWRWVRLLIFLLIVLVPISLAASALDNWDLKLWSDAPQEKLGFWVMLCGLLLLLLVLMAVRLWFDMAQVRAVAEQEFAMRKTLFRAFRLTWNNFASLFWLYFRISFLAWFVLIFWLALWLHLSGAHMGRKFLAFQIVLLWWIGTRLWQRASETVWYERWTETQAVVAPVPAPVPAVPALPAI